MLYKTTKKDTIYAKGIEIGIYTKDFQNEYISMTDIAKFKSDDPNNSIRNWMRNKETMEFLGIWEQLHNPDFNPIEFDGFRKQAGLNAFTMSPTKWIEGVNAIGIVTKAGKYGKLQCGLISQRKPQEQRMKLLRQLVIQQLTVLQELNMKTLT